MGNQVVHLIESASGGSFEYIVSLSKLLEKMGFEQTVIYSRRKDSPINVHERFGKSIACYEIPMSLKPSNIFSGFGLTKLRKLLKHCNADLIHCHSSIAGVLGRLAAVGLRIPLAYTPHGFAFRNARFNKWRRAIFWWIEWVLAKAPGCVIAVSQTEYRDAQKLGFGSRAKLVLTGVPIYADKSRELNSKQSQYTIVTMGRIIPSKNPELFIQIKESLDSRYNFIWIGDGPQKGQLESANIHVTGWVGHEKKIQLLMQADLFISTSCSESMPLSLLEAMSTGLPSIVSNIEAHQHIIQNRKNGMIAEGLNDFCNAVDELLSNNFYYNSVSVQSLEKVSSNYTLDIYAQNIQDVYESIKIQNQVSQ